MDAIRTIITQSLSAVWVPRPTIVDILEIALLAVLFYQIFVWVKETRAWMLLKGIIFLLVFVCIAYVLHMNTILWLASKVFNIAVTAIIIVFHPELRRALEKLGQTNFLSHLISFDNKEVSQRFNDKTIDELVEACTVMSEQKTGALIVVERDIVLKEFESTGIVVDAVVSAQLLMNIFEHNTPLHDGAVIVRGNRIVTATCYLPLSNNMQLSKELGTRHRAGVGISEVSDCLTIIVSEETGAISVADGGRLERRISARRLRECLVECQDKQVELKKRKISFEKFKKGKK